MEGKGKQIQSKFNQIVFRSGGFSVMVRNSKNRQQFLKNLVDLLDKYEFDGVDYNWEYPGYRMGRGYLEEKEIMKDYEGLAALVRETKLVFGDSGRVVSVAYYPDTRQVGGEGGLSEKILNCNCQRKLVINHLIFPQERLLHKLGVDGEVDLLYAMSYDQSGPNHSSRELAKQTIKQARDADLDTAKLCVGVPFYGRDNRGGIDNGSGVCGFFKVMFSRSRRLGHL